MTRPRANFDWLHRKFVGMSGPDLMETFNQAPESYQHATWADLKGNIADRRFADGHLPFESRKPKPKRQPVPMRADRSAGVYDDWRRGTEAIAVIPAEVYIPALTDSEPLPRGRVRCPLPDHDDLHPSATYRNTVWYCHVCAQGGDCFRLASAITGLADRGDQFVELRHWVAGRLLGVAA